MIKNQVTLQILGKDYSLTPHFKAIMQMEEKLGGILPLALKISDGKLSFTEVVHVIWACLEKGHELTFEKLGEDILSQGLAKFIPAVRDLLTICLAGELKE